MQSKCKKQLQCQIFISFSQNLLQVEAVATLTKPYLLISWLYIYIHPNPAREKQSIAWHELVLFGLQGLYYILFILISFRSSFLFCLVFLKLRIQESVDLAFYIIPRANTQQSFASHCTFPSQKLLVSSSFNLV